MAAFKILPKGTYKNKVQVFIKGDFNKTEKIEFTVDFKRLRTNKEVQQLLSEARQAVAVDDGSDRNFEIELLSRVVLGWSDVPGADDAEVPFSPEALAEMLELNDYRGGLFMRFMEDLKPITEIARKN